MERYAIPSYLTIKGPTASLQALTSQAYATGLLGLASDVASIHYVGVPNLAVSTTYDTIFASWTPPPSQFRHGVVTGYNIFYVQHSVVYLLNGGNASIRNSPVWSR